MKRVFTNIKNNFKISRSALVLTFVACFIVMFLVTLVPVSMAENLYISESVDADRYSQYLTYSEYIWKKVTSLHGYQAIFAVLVSVAAAVFTASSLTSYSRERNSIDFWESQPLTRCEHLLSNMISSFVYFFVSIVPSWYISLIIAWTSTTVKQTSFSEILQSQTTVLIFILLFYISLMATAFLASVLSGSVMSILVTFSTMLFYPAALIFFTSLVSGNAFHTPLYEIICHKLPYFAYLSPVFRYALSGYFEITPLSCLYFIGWTAAACAVAFALLKYRRSEQARFSLVFKKLRYPLQYAWAFLFTLLSAWIFYGIIDNPVWFVIGAVIGIIVSFIALNMIFDRSISKILKNFIHMLCFAGIFAVITVVFTADIFGIFKEPVPDYDKITTLDLRIYTYTETEEGAYSEEIYIFSDDTHKIDTEGKRELIRLLYEYMEKQASRDYYMPESKQSLSINLSFNCKGDPCEWYVYLHSYTSLENFGAMQYISLLEEVFASEINRDYYLYDKDGELYYVEPDYVKPEDDEKPQTVIGSGDGPTDIYVD